MTNDITDCFIELKAAERSTLSTTLGKFPVYSIRVLCRALKFI